MDFDEDIILAFLVGFSIGGLIFAGATVRLTTDLPAESESPVLTFSEDGLYDRGLSVDLPESEASVDCTVSRRSEFHVSESVFLYNSTNCSTSFGVGDGNLSLNSSGVDVLFKATDLGEEFEIAYDFSDNALVCSISAVDREENDGNQYPADCSVVEEDLSETWNNESFSDFNVIERGQDTIESESEG